MTKPLSSTILNPWTIQWVVAFSFALRYFLSDRLPPLPHESWEISKWNPVWSPELRWVNLGVFLIFILTWFWVNRKRGADISIKPILLFHFVTPVMILTATWSPIPSVWLVLLLSLALAMEMPPPWRWTGLIPTLALGWFFPLALFFVPGLAFASFRNTTSRSWTRHLSPALAALSFLALMFLEPISGGLSLELLSDLAFHFGWANLGLLGLFGLLALVGSLKQTQIEPFEQALIWLSLPFLALLLSCKDLDRGLILLALPFPFLLAILCRFSLLGSSRVAFSIACLALSLSHIPLGLEGTVPKDQPWFHVDWAANAEKSHKLKTLIDSLEDEMNNPDNIIITSSDQKALLNLLTDHSVLAYPPKGSNLSYSLLHRPGLWIMDRRLEMDELKDFKNLLGGLGFWKQISIGRNEKKRKHFWIYRFEQLKRPF